MGVPGDASAGRRGRPPGTSARELELISLRMFTEDGFDDTTVERIAAAAGVSKRTFFRYFDSKADVLWHAFDGEVRALRAVLRAIPADVPMMEAIRQEFGVRPAHTLPQMLYIRARAKKRFYRTGDGKFGVIAAKRHGKKAA